VNKKNGLRAPTLFLAKSSSRDKTEIITDKSLLRYQAWAVEGVELDMGGCFLDMVNPLAGKVTENFGLNSSSCKRLISFSASEEWYFCSSKRRAMGVTSLSTNVEEDQFAVLTKMCSPDLSVSKRIEKARWVSRTLVWNGSP